MDGNQKERLSSTPVIIVFAMLLVILISPAIVTYHESYQIYTSITWVIRTEQGEPLQAYLTFNEIFALQKYFLEYIFLWMIYRYYRNRTTFVRAFSVGVISEVYLFVIANLGTIINVLLIPGSRGHYDIPLPFALISFLLVAVLIHRPQSETNPPSEEWLERNKD